MSNSALLPGLFFTALLYMYPNGGDSLHIVVPNEVVAIEFEYKTHSTKYDISVEQSSEEQMKLNEMFTDHEFFTRKIYVSKPVYQTYIAWDDTGKEYTKYYKSDTTYRIILGKNEHKILRIWLWRKNGQRILGTNLGSPNHMSVPLNTLQN
jgi:hypothetical protein